MATPKKSHRRFLCSSEAAPETEPEYAFELDESDVWSTNDVINEPNSTKPARPSRKPKSTTNSTKPMSDRPMGPKSLPVNVPDWSKILRGEYRKHGLEDDDVDVEDFDGNDKLPPHEYLARTRAASLSVHEGFGRTLKGRDLSRVRDAIWRQTGFED